MTPRRPSRIVFSVGAIFAAFIILVIAFVISSLFVLNVSSKAANELKLAADKRAVSNLIDREVHDVAQRLSEVAWWDETVAATGEELDMSFFEDALLGWFPNEYGIDRSALVATDFSLRLHADGTKFVTNVRAESFLSQTRDLVAKAQMSYFELRSGEGGEFWFDGNPVNGETPLFVSDLRKIDGVYGIAVAQAVVPDGDLTLPDGSPQVLVAFRKFTPERIAEYSTEIELNGLAISSNAPANMEKAIAYSSSRVGPAIYVSWISSLPSDGIWKNSMPALGGMLATISLVMLGITIAYARLVYRTRQAEARNRFLAEHDSLTGLSNRALFDRRLQAEIGEDRMGKCAVLCIDLDRFKPVNDTYGHQAGDEVLRIVAQRIETAIGDRGLVARLGGDEFIALLCGVVEKDQIMLLCDNIIEQICQEISFEDHELYVGASVGVAWWPDDGKTADMVIRSADQALYRAKELGRGRAVRADEVKPSVKLGLVKQS